MSVSAVKLSIENIGKSFPAGARNAQDVVVLRDINLSLEPGEFLILVGPSGCGKSTLLNIISGLEQPSTGRILLGEREITSLGPAERDIAMVFQSYALYPTMTVAQNIGFGLEMRGMAKQARQARIAEVAKMLQLEPLLDRKPAALSGGQRQRVAMGRALARSPSLFLFDEPLSNLDAKLRVDMRAEIKRLHALGGVTSVYVTHDQIEAMTLGTRIAVMNGGVIQQLGTPQEVYNQPANLFVASFIGSPSINLLPAQVAASAFGLVPPAQAHTLGLRPESLSLQANSEIKATVTDLELTGADSFVRLEMNGLGSLLTRTAAEPQLAKGQILEVAINANGAHWFDSSGNRVPF